jgi:BirA family biotin operon repressor/biotin-[acetyl-CoA-carboxylase] ligase
LGLTRLVYEVQVTSTMDVAHALAQDGAPGGTMVLAGTQHAGRGRAGRPWVSEPDGGIWLTLLERPADVRALEVLALRCGLALARTLAPFVDGRVQLKWPNDVLVARRKLAGILIEVRWRDAKPEWVAIGVGINRRVPKEFAEATALRQHVLRDDVLRTVVPALRAAAAQHGPLSPRECAEWAAQDAAAGRRVREPLAGDAQGIADDGALLVRTDDGEIRRAYSGSLVFDDLA